MGDYVKVLNCQDLVSKGDLDWKKIYCFSKIINIGKLLVCVCIYIYMSNFFIFYLFILIHYYLDVLRWSKLLNDFLGLHRVILLGQTCRVQTDVLNF